MEQMRKYPSPYLVPGLPHQQRKPLDLVDLFGKRRAFEIIVNVTSMKTGVSLEDIMGSSRKKSKVQARHISMYLCTELIIGHVSLDEIAYWMKNSNGSGDHTSVIHARNVMRDIVSGRTLGSYAESSIQFINEIKERLKEIIYESNSTNRSRRKR